LLESPFLRKDFDPCCSCGNLSQIPTRSSTTSCLLRGGTLPGRCNWWLWFRAFSAER
jgi:hypothetical protein